MKNLLRINDRSKYPVMSTTTFFLTRRHDARHTLRIQFFALQTSHVLMNLISSCQEFIKEDSGALGKDISSTRVERDDYSFSYGK